jgi:DNA-binding HxlR family transcriptional regulator
MGAANRRYLEFISALEDSSAGNPSLAQDIQDRRRERAFYRGFNFFDDDEQSLFAILARGELNISGRRNRDFRRFLPGRTTTQISRTLKRLRVHGLLKRAGSTYKYYLTKLGRLVLLAALKLKELVLTTQLGKIDQTRAAFIRHWPSERRHEILLLCVLGRLCGGCFDRLGEDLRCKDLKTG